MLIIQLHSISLGLYTHYGSQYHGPVVDKGGPLVSLYGNLESHISPSLIRDLIKWGKLDFRKLTSENGVSMPRGLDGS